MILRRPYYQVIVAFLFSLLMVAFPWNQIKTDSFWDRTVYIENIESGLSSLDNKNYDNYFSFFSGEILWHYLIDFLYRELGVEVKFIFGCVSFFFLFFSVLYVLRWSGVAGLFLIVNPLFVDLAFSQVRMALALSVFMLLFLRRDRGKSGVIIMLLASLIHSSMIVFSLFYAFSVVVCARDFGYRKAILACLTLALVSCLALGPLRESILSVIGDRRAEYSDMKSSFAFMFFWFVSLVVFVFFSAKNKVGRDFYFFIVVLAVACGNYFVDFYSTRFLAAGLPFLIAHISFLQSKARVVYVFFFITYAVLQWGYWVEIYKAF